MSATTPPPVTPSVTATPTHPDRHSDPADPTVVKGRDPARRDAPNPFRTVDLGVIDFWAAFKESGAAKVCFERIRDLEERINQVTILPRPRVGSRAYRDDDARQGYGRGDGHDVRHGDDARRGTAGHGDDVHRGDAAHGDTPAGPVATTDPAVAATINDHEPDRFGNRVGAVRGYPGQGDRSGTGTVPVVAPGQPRLRPRDGQIDTIFRECLSSSKTFEILAQRACDALNENNWSKLGPNQGQGGDARGTGEAPSDLVGDRHGNRGTVGNPTPGTGKEPPQEGHDVAGPATR